MSGLENILIIIAIVLGFGVTIFVHELGHFIMARRAKVKVETFAIGMGPLLWKIKTDKHGTDWVIRLLPIGGYVKMKGQEDLPGKEKKNLDPESYQSKSPKQRFGIIVAGVVMNVLFAYFLLVIAFNIGVPFIPNTVGAVTPGSPAAVAGIKVGDEIVKIGSTKVECWEDLQVAKILLNKDKKTSITIIRNGEKIRLSIPTQINSEDIDGVQVDMAWFGIQPSLKAVVGKSSEVPEALRDNNQNRGNASIYPGQSIVSAEINGKPAFYSLNGIYRLIINNPGKEIKMRLKSRDGEIIEKKMNITSIEIFDMGFQYSAYIRPMLESPAIKAGLKEGDKILSIDDQKIKGWQDVLDYCANITQKAPLKIKILRGKQEKEIQVTPYFNSAEERYLLGITPVLDPALSKQISWVSPSFKKIFESPKVGEIVHSIRKIEENEKIIYEYQLQQGEIKRNFYLSRDQLQTKKVGKLFPIQMQEKVVKYSFFSSLYLSGYRAVREIQDTYSFLKKMLSRELSPKMLGGPIRIFQVSYQVTKERGITFFLLLFAKIGFSLAFFNILPIPVLDGGHAVFILYEWVRGKPVPEKIMVINQSIGFLLLLILFFFVMTNDLIQLGLF